MKHRELRDELRSEALDREVVIKCPSCSSVNAKYFDHKKLWRCQDCDESFGKNTSQQEVKVTNPQTIFISYPHKPPRHAELALKVCQILKERGHYPWIDVERITAGTDWREAITRGILESDWVLAFMSTHSVRDPGVCLNELGIALNQKAGDDTLRTVLLENEKTVRPPMSLTHIQWIDLADFEAKMPEDSADPIQRKQWEEGIDTEVQKLIDSIEGKGRVAGDIAYLKQRLKPASFIGEIAAKTTNFSGRQWLFQKIEYWRRERRSERVLWINGPAGIGKSAVAGRLAHSERSTVVGVHFCKWNDATTQDAGSFVRTMAFQVASRHPDYRALLVKIIDEKFEGKRLEEGKTSELYRELIANPLATDRMAIDAGRDRHIIVIDGLDEVDDSNNQGEASILDLVANEFPKLPEWLGVVVTSRPKADIVSRLGNIFGLEMQTTENNEDLYNYLCNGLRAQFDQGERGKRALDDAVKTAVSRSDGIMLYAVELLKDIRRGRETAVQPSAFPQGLAGIYFDNLKRACNDVPTYRQEIQPLLELVASSPVPVPEKLAMAVLDLNQASFNDVFKKSSILLIRRHSQRGATLQLFHNSLREWLTCPDNPHDYQLENVGIYWLADFLWDDYKAAMHGHALNEEGIDEILKNKMRWWNFSDNTILSPRLLLRTITARAKVFSESTGSIEKAVEYAKREVSLQYQTFGGAHDLFEMALDELRELEKRLGKS